jgi:hypothetical protein
MTSLENCDIKLYTEKGCFIPNIISTLDDVVKLEIV